MITIEFGAAENQTLDPNSLYIKMFGNDFQQSLERIKGFWNRKYLKDSREWEIPYSCFEEIKELFSDTEIKYLNNPPKARFVSESDITTGMDFNGYNLYDYQLEGVQYGLNHHNFLLLDDMGLRKNPASCSYC